MTARVPRVAVLGRQNVGKSTLVNRLFGRRAAIADDAPGVTRDRIELETTWRGRRLGLVDTAGFLSKAKGVEALAGAQAERAASEADVVVLLVDAQTGITEDDAVLARRLRKAAAPVVLVVNKVDADRDGADAFVFQALGLGEPVPISALHGRGTGDLLDRLTELLPEAPEEVEVQPEPRVAIIGRPNVGKSSLFNRIVGEERSVVFEEAGTTRDAVDAIVSGPDGVVRFVDTAGMRRRTKTQGLEYYSLVRSTDAIQRADVVALVIDASQGMSLEDRKIASRTLEAGRGLVIAANKWDLVDGKDHAFKSLESEAEPMARAPVVRTSALTGLGVHRLPPILLEVRARWVSRASTSRVNDVLQRAHADRPAPRSAGPIRYATQVSSGPPSFVLFGGKEPSPSYRRFIEHRLREEFGLEGVPIRLRFRSRHRGDAR